MSAAAAAAKKKAAQERYYKYNSARGQAKDCYRRGEYGKAADYCTTAIDYSEEGRELPLLVSRSKAHCNLGNYEAALDDTAEVLKKMPKDINAVGQDARTLYCKNIFEDAMVTNVTAARRRIKPDNFVVGTAVCRATIEECIGESAGPIMHQSKLGKTVVSMTARKECAAFVNEEQRDAFYKRNRTSKDKFLAEKYLGRTAKDKEFLISSKNLPNISGPNKETTQKLFDIMDEAIASLNMRQEMLMAESPVYVWKYKETLTSTDRQKEIDEEKIRFKAGAMTIVDRLNKELRAAYEAHDVNQCFKLAFRLQRYIVSHCNFFLRWKERKPLEDAIYNVVGEFYLGMKWLDRDMNEEKQKQRIYCMLGTELPDTQFIQNVKASLMPHVLEKKPYRRNIEEKLEIAVCALKRTFLYHELAMCWSNIKHAELSLKASQKGYTYAKSIGSKTWCINNGFLMARAHFLQGDVEDARETLTDCLSRAYRLGRTNCVNFLEKVLDIVKREETKPFVTISPIKKRQQQIMNLMPNNEMRREIQSLFREIDRQPLEKRFNIMPKTDESDGDRRTNKRAIRLTTQVKRKTVTTLRVVNPCEEEPYSDAPATFIL